MTRRKTMPKIFIWILVILGIGGTTFGFIKFTNNPASDQTVLSAGVISASDWIKGNKDSKVVLVEYSDFQCPACGAYQPLVKQLLQELNTEKFVFAYRYFPLYQIHQNAESAAQAAEAAGGQGKFWEMHDILFDNQKSWSNKRNAEEDFIKYAESLDLNIDKFRNDLTSKEIKNKITSDYRSGQKAGVNSTPTFFLNGKKLQNPRNYEEFKKLIKDAISNQE